MAKKGIIIVAVAVLIALGMMYYIYNAPPEVDTVDTIEGSGSCLPGTDECVESCAQGQPATCPNPGGTPRTCDCSHPWNSP